MLIGLLSKSAESFVVFFALAFLLGAAQVPVPYVKAVTNWYDKRLGVALGSAMLLSGVGVAVVPPLSAALINAVGWRMAYVSLATIVWVVTIPSVAFLLHEPPLQNTAEGELLGKRQNPSCALTGMTLTTAIRTRRFWLLAVGFYLISVVVGGGTHVLPIILSDHGFNTQESSSVMTIVGIAMMVARFSFGALLDRFKAPILTGLVFFGAAIGFFILASGVSNVTVPFAAVFIGLTLGAEVDALAYLACRVFGRRHLGMLYGILMFCFSFGLGCGPALFGQIHEQTGDYQEAFWFSAAAAIVAALTIVSIKTKS